MDFTKVNTVIKQGFDGRGFTDQNTLSKAMLTQPDQLSPVLTHLMGREDKKFPLTFLTEGQGNLMLHKAKELNDIQFTWRTIRRLRKADTVVSSTYTSSDTNVGMQGEPVYLVFASNWLKRSHMIVHKSGVKARIQGQPESVGNGYYKYKLVSLNKSYPIPFEALSAGAKWSMIGGAPVSESNSMGTESNVVTPGSIKNQMSILRKSYRLSGNVSNKYVDVQLTTDKGTSNMWIDFERWQHLQNWKQDCEEHLWYSTYNRDAEGEIDLVDEDSSEIIPLTAGMFQQIPNNDTYSILTAKKIKNTVSDALSGATDTGNMDMTLFCGEGFADDFDMAMKDESSNFNQITGDKFVKGSGRNLVLGGYFTAYEHVDGHIVRLAKLPLLDHGPEAEIADRHPITGKPMTSHEGYFVDTSQYEGENNIQMVSQKGRSLITGTLKGMAPTPWDFKGNGVNDLATEQDTSSYHMLKTMGLAVRRNTHCFSLKCNLS